MLNRTNRTLSANLNRLNLGTRSLVLANGYHGKQTQRALHAEGLAMRDGMPWGWDSDPGFTTPDGISIPGIPCSTGVVPWPVVGLVVRPLVGRDATTDLILTGSGTAESGCLAKPGQGRPSERSERRARRRQPRQRQGLRGGQFRSIVAASARAARPAAAITAAAGG
jgi:hypothetical protein